MKKDTIIAFIITLIFHGLVLSITFPSIKKKIFEEPKLIEVHLVKFPKKVSKVSTVKIKKKKKIVKKKKVRKHIVKKKEIIKKEKKQIISKLPANPKVVKEKEIIQASNPSSLETEVVEKTKTQEVEETGTGTPSTFTTAKPLYGSISKPHYPLIARKRGYQGVVILKVKVLKDGTVGEIKIKKSSGYKILDKAAVEEVKKWKFIPAKEGGVAIDCWVEIPIVYKLTEG